MMEKAANEIPRQSVDSSNIASIGYDEQSKTLVVEFKRGGLYSYSDVPESTFRNLMDAESIGSTFHKTIKTHGYAFSKL